MFSYPISDPSVTRPQTPQLVPYIRPLRYSISYLFCKSHLRPRQLFNSPTVIPVLLAPLPDPGSVTGALHSPAIRQKQLRQPSSVLMLQPILRPCLSAPAVAASRAAPYRRLQRRRRRRRPSPEPTGNWSRRVGGRAPASARAAQDRPATSPASPSRPRHQGPPIDFTAASTALPAAAVGVGAKGRVARHQQTLPLPRPDTLPDDPPIRPGCPPK